MKGLHQSSQILFMPLIFAKRLDLDLLYLADFFTYCQSEYNAKLKIREEQAEGRRQRLEEKKAILERMEHPPEAEPTKLDRKGKQQKKLGMQVKLEPVQEPELLPYLPTPDEIILQRDGAFLDEGN